MVWSSSPERGSSTIEKQAHAIAQARAKRHLLSMYDEETSPLDVRCRGSNILEGDGDGALRDRHRVTDARDLPARYGWQVTGGCRPEIEKLPCSVCGEPTLTFLLEQDETVVPVCDEHLPKEAREMCQKLREFGAENIH
jgi:hypothetical protein